MSTNIGKNWNGPEKNKNIHFRINFEYKNLEVNDENSIFAKVNLSII